ncbi:MAG: PEP-CTERM/exosortase system-associated acyltransferase [Candidatus Omnitrophota bacterium]
MVAEERFIFKRLETPAERMDSFHLRYQVYCKECHFISETDYPLGYECDSFDECSLHFGAFDLKGQLIGGSRLILADCARFPIEEHCSSLNVDYAKTPREKFAEVSRLTISKFYRRRSNDGLYYGPQSADETVEDKGELFLRRVRPMAFGLYRSMYHESKRRGIRYWYALMEKSLWLLLKIHGFVFRPVGPEVDFYGLVTPYFVDIADLEQNVYSKFPQFFQFFMQDLEPELQPKF